MPVSDYSVRPLTSETWDAFAQLVEANNGVWGGCWCMGFHVKLGKGRTPQQNRAEKKQLVRDGRTHAALVFDGVQAVGWCQYGSPEELPNIHHRKEYEKTLDTWPDYRLTCFFVDRDYRQKGVAGMALQGALDLIAQAGGGVVEGYPHDTQGKKTSAWFLYATTRSLFEQYGFSFQRSKGQKNTVIRWVVADNNA